MDAGNLDDIKRESACRAASSFACKHKASCRMMFDSERNQTLSVDAYKRGKVGLTSEIVVVM